MKKIILLALTVVLCMSCAAKKPVKKSDPESQKSTVQQVDPMQAKIDSLKRIQELRKIEREMEIEDAKHEAEMSKLNMQKRLEGGLQMLLVPCAEEALQLEKRETMAAQGIATGKRSEEDAMLDANRIALSDITTRFLGVIKNGIEQYVKDTRAQSGNRGLESQLEGLALSVGEKEINKHFKVACREFAKDKAGNYNCYEALYVETEKVVDAIIDAAEEEKVDFDKYLFRKRMEAELDRQAEKQKEINKQKLNELNSAKEEMGIK